MLEYLFHYGWSDFAQGTLSFESWVPGEVRLLAAAGLLLLAWWLYRRERHPLSTSHRRVLTALRCMTVVILLFMIFQPALRIVAPLERSLFIAVLLDSSRSMTIQDARALAGSSRYAAAKQLLAGRPETGQPGLLTQLQGKAKVFTYSFDNTLKRAQPAALPEPEGRQTNLFRTIHDLDTELRSAPLAAVVLLTDGRRNTGGSGEDAAALLKARGTPLFAVGFGDPTPAKDLEVIRVFAPDRVRRNTEVEVQVTIRHTGFGKPFPVEILRGESVLLRQEVQPAPQQDLTDLRLAFTPDFSGSATYSVRVPAQAGEQSTANNQKDFVIDLDDSRLPVLYVEGSPRLEYRYLRRAMYQDADFRVVGMLRLAPDRFYLQEANQTDKVTADGQTEQDYLKSGFPDTEEKLYRFQAIILGDMEAGFFDAKRQKLLENFVKQRGGGLLMLGGVNSFGLGGYAGTPIGEMLPVRIAANGQPYDKMEFQPKFTKDGLTHPVMHLLDDKVANQKLWEGMPPLIGLTPVQGMKPGASLLVQRMQDDLPVLAVQKVGAGRVAAFMSGGSWYWQMSRPASDVFHEKFWKQTIRWLVVGAREQISVTTDREIYNRRDPVGIRATILGADLHPVNSAVASATITDPLGNSETVPLDWTLAEDGVYQCSYVPGVEGNYRVKVQVEGWKNTQANCGFLVTEPVAEFSDSSLNEELLQAMAAQTGGAYFNERDVTGLAERIDGALKQAKNAAGAVENKPLWDMPVLFGLLIALLCAEWLLRRKWDLA